MKITIEFDDKEPVENIVHNISTAITAAKQKEKMQTEHTNKYEKPQLLNENEADKEPKDLDKEYDEKYLNHYNKNFVHDPSYKPSKEIEELEKKLNLPK